MSKAGTKMTQEDYAELEKSSLTEELSEADAKILINTEFGFEVSRIEILHEGELNVTEEGSIYVQIEKVPRKPLSASTDWNYIRFNIRTAPATWFYEMINGDLCPIDL